MEMMIAMTASPNASSRVLLISAMPAGNRHGPREVVRAPAAGRAADCAPAG
jgi:hypothetical protein